MPDNYEYRSPHEDTRKERLAAKAPRITPPKNFRPAGGGPVVTKPTKLVRTAAMLQATAAALVNKLTGLKRTERAEHMRQLQQDDPPLFKVVANLLNKTLQSMSSDAYSVGMDPKDAAADPNQARTQGLNSRMQ